MFPSKFQFSNIVTVKIRLAHGIRSLTSRAVLFK